MARRSSPSPTDDGRYTYPKPGARKASPQLTPGFSRKVLDWDYRVTARKIGFTINKTAGDSVSEFPIERARIRTIWYAVFMSIASTVALGWVVETHTHLAVLIVLLFVSGTFFTGIFNASCFPTYIFLLSPPSPPRSPYPPFPLSPTTVHTYRRVKKFLSYASS